MKNVLCFWNLLFSSGRPTSKSGSFRWRASQTLGWEFIKEKKKTRKKENKNSYKKTRVFLHEFFFAWTLSCTSACFRACFLARVLFCVDAFLRTSSCFRVFVCVLCTSPFLRGCFLVRFISLRVFVIFSYYVSLSGRREGEAAGRRGSRGAHGP